MCCTDIFHRLHSEAHGNLWIRRFTVFNRLVLAAGFIPSGLVKVLGERFTSLSVNHPMGHYLEALHQTGYYYTFIGIMQVSAAILLLIPRTATIGAILYFPIILNICILSFALRFDGSLLTSPLMLLASIYLLCWDFDKLKVIIPVNQSLMKEKPSPPQVSNKFPSKFFIAVTATVFVVSIIVFNAFSIRPRNTMKECKQQFTESNRTKAGNKFCDCIHKYGYSLNRSLKEYYNSADDNKDCYLEPILPSAFFFEY